MKAAYLYNAIVTVLITVVVYAFAPAMLRLISGSSEPVIIENGSLYLKVAAPAFFVLGLINDTRTGTAGNRKQGAAAFFQCHRADWKNPLRQPSRPALPVPCRRFLRAGHLVLYGGGAGDRVLDESGGEGRRETVRDQEKRIYR